MVKIYIVNKCVSGDRNYEDGLLLDTNVFTDEKRAQDYLNSFEGSTLESGGELFGNMIESEVDIPVHSVTELPKPIESWYVIYDKKLHQYLEKYDDARHTSYSHNSSSACRFKTFEEADETAHKNCIAYKDHEILNVSINHVK